KVAKKVTIINLTESLKGDEILLKNVSSAANVEVINESSVLEIKGKNFVESVSIEHTKTHTERNIVAQGVFIEIGWTPAVDFIPQVAKDKNNQIVVNEFGVTSVPGIWAAGDVNNLWGEQIIIAAGEGAKVALIVAEHISKLPHQATSNVHEGA
ncbi:FAD-dependent oxidoreductase, partial [Candidatus Daviesbacteria bacterium]|nr:FAD-dependent oxidoreductase [Candidatus Daviesbacteria bacterium]